MKKNIQILNTSLIIVIDHSLLLLSFVALEEIFSSATSDIFDQFLQSHVLCDHNRKLQDIEGRQMIQPVCVTLQVVFIFGMV